MSESTSPRPVRVVFAILLGIAPFVVGLARLFRQHDDRYLILACAAAAGTALVMLSAKAPNRLARQALLAFLVATVFGAAAGYLAGAHALIGIIMVAVVEAAFLVASWVVAAA